MVREILSGGDSRAGVHHGPQPALDHLLPSRRPLDFRCQPNAKKPLHELT